MADDKRKTGKADRIRINVRQVFEVRHWTKALGITKACLLEAVKAAGPMLADVKKYLIQKINEAR